MTHEELVLVPELCKDTLGPVFGMVLFKTRSLYSKIEVIYPSSHYRTDLLHPSSPRMSTTSTHTISKDAAKTSPISHGLCL